MAEVFVATQSGDGGFEKTVAIKRILPHLCEDPETVAMFRDEALLASRLSHPNIAQVFDFVEDEGTLLIAMEWIEGKDLRRVQMRAEKLGPRLSPVRAIAIAEKVACALAHAHAALDGEGAPLNLVHRDVSPHNVMLTYEGSVKLTDFGIAKATQRSVHTATGMIKGKVAYMSPEQARGEPVDARTDVFALGVILWELLCERRLFTGDGDLAILRAVQEQAIPTPRSIRPQLPEGVDALVMKALTRELEDRLPSAEVFAEAASEILLESARQSNDLSLGPWMRALYPAESRGVRSQTARRPASAAAASVSGSAEPPSPPYGVQQDGPTTRPDLPGRLAGAKGLEAANAAVAATSALGPGELVGDLESDRRFKRILFWFAVAGFAAITLWNLAKIGIIYGRSESGQTQEARSSAVEPADSVVGVETPLEAPGPASARPEATPAAAATAVPDQKTERPAARRTSRSRRGPARKRPALAGAEPVAKADPSAPSEDPEPAPAAPSPPSRGGTRVLARPEGPGDQSLTLRAGTRLEVRLLDSARAGEPVRLELTRSVVLGGRVALPGGTRLRAVPRGVDRRLHLLVRSGTTPAGVALLLRARAVDSKGAAGLPASDPTSPVAPLLLAPGTRIQLELLEPLVIGD